MGYRREQKTQAPLPFLPLTLEKLQKNVYLKKLTTGPAPPPPPFESATKAKASFFGKLILVILSVTQFRPLSRETGLLDIYSYTLCDPTLSQYTRRVVSFLIYSVFMLSFMDTIVYLVIKIKIV